MKIYTIPLCLLCAGAVLAPIPASAKNIVTTTTIFYSYAMPNSEPKITKRTRVLNHCNPVSTSGETGSGRTDTGSYGDVDGDGFSDVTGYSADPPGTDDGYGDGGTTTSSPGQDSFGGGFGGTSDTDGF